MKLKGNTGYFILIAFAVLFSSCINRKDKSAAEILGNPNYLAFSYGGYRHNSRDIVPTINELKEDLKILSAMGVKLLRTYNTSQYAHAENLLAAIHQLKKEDRSFEMYIMLGSWIECEGAWTSEPNHSAGNVTNNSAEIDAAVRLINTYPDIVKIIAVGNEAMVHWASGYFVRPAIISKWVNYLQDLKSTGKIPEDTWITSSDNFASWGGEKDYHNDELAELIQAVDYVSLHTYPFHDTYYHPVFWKARENEEHLTDRERVDAAMKRAKDYAVSQYQSAAEYIHSLAPDKAIHIGETGWSTVDAAIYGTSGSYASDEYKEKLFYDYMREWTTNAGMSCFYFEAFDEKWKDSRNHNGSENHFGLITLEGEAKYVLWDMVDKGIFKGLTRGGKEITKTYGGSYEKMMADMLVPPFTKESPVFEIETTNKTRTAGENVTEEIYVVFSGKLVPDSINKMSYPSARLKLNAWENTCNIEISDGDIVKISAGTGTWWGCGLEMQPKGEGENLSNFAEGHLHFSIKGDSLLAFDLGFQTGEYDNGTQTNNFLRFEPGKKYSVTGKWVQYSIPVPTINNDADLKDITSILFLKGNSDEGNKQLFIKDIYYTQK